MEGIQYPIDFKFNIGSLANDFTATDANGKTLAYVRQKMFKLKEDIVIYKDNSRAEEMFRIKADKWLDFNTAYTFLDKENKELGKIARKGWKSLFKIKYDIIDGEEKIEYKITEKNPWIKFFDALIGEIPIVSFFTGYILNPTYTVNNLDNKTVVELKKMPSLFGRKFQLNKIDQNDSSDGRILLGLMMMILLERRRG